MTRTRNTPTHRICRACDGDGFTTINDTDPHGYGPDPQCDEDVQCDACDGTGWVRCVPADPIFQLRPLRPYATRRRLVPAYAVRYGELLARVADAPRLP